MQTLDLETLDSTIGVGGGGVGLEEHVLAVFNDVREQLQFQASHSHIHLIWIYENTQVSSAAIDMRSVHCVDCLGDDA